MIRPFPELGSMTPVRQYQLLCTTLTETEQQCAPGHVEKFEALNLGSDDDIDETPTKDKLTVKTALSLFLNGITLHFDIPAEWLFPRKAFRFERNNDKIFDASVDGCLVCTTDSKIKAIIVVKPYLCGDGGSATTIRMQEGAQVAAWISNDPDPVEDTRKVYEYVHQS